MPALVYFKIGTLYACARYSVSWPNKVEVCDLRTRRAFGYYFF